MKKAAVSAATMTVVAAAVSTASSRSPFPPTATTSCACPITWIAGGLNFVYRLELIAAEPEVFFASPQYSVNDNNYRQFIAVPKGGRYATLVNVTRTNVSGDFKFEVKNMPQGVKLLTEMAPKDLGSVPLLFEAAADAPLGHQVVPITLNAVDPSTKSRGKLRQEFDIVRNGNVVYYTQIEDRLPVAVVEEAPYSLEIVNPPCLW